MKYMIWMGLMSVSFLTVRANDIVQLEGRNPIRTLLAESKGAQELYWQGKNLTNEDFNGLNNIAPHVTSLDLSNNSFKGDFSLSACLRAFKYLEKLTMNNNPVTGFATDKDFKNTTLKTLVAQNTKCVKVNLKMLYTNYKLETIDLSDSKFLNDFVVPTRGFHGRTTLQVHLRNVVINSKFQKTHSVPSELACDLKVGCTAAGALLALVPHMALCFTQSSPVDTYCVRSPIARHESDSGGALDVTKALANSSIHTTPWFVGGLMIGGLAGKVITYCCLPNHGQVTALQYITNSTDEAAEEV